MEPQRNCKECKYYEECMRVKDRNFYACKDFEDKHENL